MKTFYLTLTTLFLSTSLFAQVQFASYLIDFSSEYHVEIDTICNTTWSACQILHEPDVYPIYADNGNSWASQSPDAQREFIAVGFDDPIAIDAVYAYQTLNTGAIDSVYLRNSTNGEWELVWWDTAEVEDQTSKIFAATFPMTSYLVNGVRLALNSPAVPGFNEIDAISIGGYILNNKSVGVVTADVRLFPNPSNSGFTVNAGNDLVETIRVMDMLGRTVYEVNGMNTVKATVDEQFEKGIYTVEVIGKEYKQRIRFVKE